MKKIAFSEMLNAPWNKLLKRNLVIDNSICFNVKFSICEDMLFSVDCIRKAKQLVVNEKAYYHYIIQETDSLRTRYHSNFFEAAKTVFLRDMDYCDAFDDNDEQKTIFATLFSETLMAQMKRIVNCLELTSSQKKEELKKIISDPVFREAVERANFRCSGLKLLKKKIVRFFIKQKMTRFIFLSYKIKN